MRRQPRGDRHPAGVSPLRSTATASRHPRPRLTGPRRPASVQPHEPRRSRGDGRGRHTCVHGRRTAEAWWTRDARRPSGQASPEYRSSGGSHPCRNSPVSSSYDCHSTRMLPRLTNSVSKPTSSAQRMPVKPLSTTATNSSSRPDNSAARSAMSRMPRASVTQTTHLSAGHAVEGDVGLRPPGREAAHEAPAVGRDLLYQ